MTKFDFTKPAEQYSDEELLASKQYKRLAKKMPYRGDVELLHYIRQDIEAHRQECFEHQFQQRTAEYVKFLNSIGYAGQDFAIQGLDDIYVVSPLDKYQDPEEDVEQPAPEPSPKFRKAVRTKPKKPQSVDQIIKGAKARAEKAAQEHRKKIETPEQRAVRAKIERSKERLDRYRENEPPTGGFVPNGPLSKELEDIPPDGIACQDLECSGILSYVGRIRDTKGCSGYYCEVCEKHWAKFRARNGSSIKFMELNEFRESLKRSDEKHERQSKKRADRNWELITWEQVDSWRDDNFLTVADIATMVGVTPHTAYSWAQGTSAPSMDNQRKLKNLISEPADV